MDRKIIFIKGGSQYALMDHFFDQLDAEFAKLGQATDAINVLGAQAELDRFATLDPQATLGFVTFNGIGVELPANNGQMYFQAFGRPVLSLYIDSPLYHFQRITADVSTQRCAFIDASHPTFVQALTNRHHDALFVPHFACVDPQASVPDQASEQRDIDVLVPATIRDSAAMLDELQQVDQSMRDDVQALIAIESAHDSLDETTILQQFLKATGKPGELEHVQRAVGLMRFVDGYMRAKRREDCLDALANAGMTVDVFGNVASQSPGVLSHRLHEPVPLAEMGAMMGRAKIVLDPGENYHHAAHERVLTAMAGGAVPVAARNAYWTHIDDDQQAMLLYGREELEPLAGRIRGLLDDVQSRRSRAERGRSYVSGHHTARHRCEAILQVLRGDL